MGKRFLAVNRLLGSKRLKCRNRVRVVRRAYGDSVNFVAHLVEHFPEIVVGRCIFELLLFLVQSVVIDVTNRDNFSMVSCVGRIACTLSTHANTAKTNFF